MQFTEPQAGSDLGALRTRAVAQRDERWGEHYRISGQKIFITYGDHDLCDNIVHMGLARTPDAPPGSRRRVVRSWISWSWGFGRSRPASPKG